MKFVCLCVLLYFFLKAVISDCVCSFLLSVAAPSATCPPPELTAPSASGSGMHAHSSLGEKNAWSHLHKHFTRFASSVLSTCHCSPFQTWDTTQHTYMLVLLSLLKWRRSVIQAKVIFKLVLLTASFRKPCDTDRQRASWFGWNIWHEMTVFQLRWSQWSNDTPSFMNLSFMDLLRYCYLHRPLPASHFACLWTSSPHCLCSCMQRACASLTSLYPVYWPEACAGSWKSVWHNPVMLIWLLAV